MTAVSDMPTTLGQKAGAALDAIEASRLALGQSPSSPTRYVPTRSRLSQYDWKVQVLPIIEYVMHAFTTDSNEDGIYFGAAGDGLRQLLKEQKFDLSTKQVNELVRWVSATIRAHGLVEQVSGGPRGGEWLVRANWRQLLKVTPHNNGGAVYHADNQPLDDQPDMDAPPVVVQSFDLISFVIGVMKGDYDDVLDAIEEAVTARREVLA